jgi:hypothetical protein
MAHLEICILLFRGQLREAAAVKGDLPTFGHRSLTRAPEGIQLFPDFRGGGRRNSLGDQVLITEHTAMGATEMSKEDRYNPR